VHVVVISHQNAVALLLEDEKKKKTLPTLGTVIDPSCPPQSPERHISLHHCFYTSNSSSCLSFLKKLTLALVGNPLPAFVF